MALLAPAGTPAPVVARLNAALNAALAQPALQERLLASGSEPGGGTPAALRERLGREGALWAGIIRAKGIKAD
jgi:tripartite-type tricarboxylate transporter receptor subunit TctC